jgi:hypothetical protein
MQNKDENWTYWDFVFPFRLGSKKLLSGKIGLFFILQFVTAAITWIIIFSLFEGQSGINSGGDRPSAYADILAIVAWFVITRIFWYIYDRKFQKK